MGRQTRYYTLPKDEIFFVDFILSLPKVHIIKTKTNLRKIEFIDRNLISEDRDGNSLDLYIWKETLQIPLNDIEEISGVAYNTEQMDYVKTGKVFYYVSSNAPVIEFSRSFVRDDNKLVQGRIWAEFYSLINGELVNKGDEFKDLYEMLSNWIRKNFQKLKGVDGYFGEEALKWYKSGGKVFP